MTGYRDLDAIRTDGKPDSYHSDCWMVEDNFAKWYQNPICRAPMFQNEETPHEDVYHWIQEQEKLCAAQTLETYLQRHISKHPEWISKYRHLRCKPTYDTEFEQFWKECCDSLKNFNEIASRSPKYPYDASVPPEKRLDMFAYQMAVFETCLQRHLVQESKKRLAEIAAALRSNK